MANDITNKTITVAALEAANGRVKLTDQDNDSYSFFQTKKDNSESNAYKTYKEFQVALNSIIEIGYTVNGKYKNIIGFRKPKAQAAASAQPFVTSGELKVKQVAQDQKWETIAEGKVRHGFALEAYKLNRPLTVATATEINAWVSYVMTGKLNPTQSITTEVDPILEENLIADFEANWQQ